MTELIKNCATSKDVTPVLEACIVQEILKTASPENIQKLLELAMQVKDFNATFRLLLNAFRDKINPNTFQVRMPKTMNSTELLLAGPTCTLLMALCVNLDQDTTPFLQAFLHTTFPTEIKQIRRCCSVRVAIKQAGSTCDISTRQHNL